MHLRGRDEQLAGDWSLVRDSGSLPGTKVMLVALAEISVSANGRVDVPSILYATALVCNFAHCTTKLLSHQKTGMEFGLLRRISLC